MVSRAATCFADLLDMVAGWSILGSFVYVSCHQTLGEYQFLNELNYIQQEIERDCPSKSKR